MGENRMICEHEKWQIDIVVNAENLCAMCMQYENNELIEALHSYAVHHANCLGDVRCTCGLKKLLKKYRPVP
jgi:hypothetical protein